MPDYMFHDHIVFDEREALLVSYEGVFLALACQACCSETTTVQNGESSPFTQPCLLEASQWRASLSQDSTDVEPLTTVMRLGF
jgi:hypothetical protein